MDNLTVVGGYRFQVAGLVPSHRYANPHWRVLDISDKLACDRNLERLSARVFAYSAGLTAARADNSHLSGVWGESPSIRRDRKDDPGLIERRIGSSPVVGERIIQIAPDALREAIEAEIARHPDESSIDIARELFMQPERLALLNPRVSALLGRLPRSAVDVMAQALILARTPALVVDARIDLAKWLADVTGADLVVGALVAAEMQPLYDYFRTLDDDQRQGCPLSGLDRMIDGVKAAVERLAFAQEGTQGNESPRDRLDGLGNPGLVAAFDRLAELETMSPTRDQGLLRAQALVRLMVGLPTPDVIDRSVRTAFKENAPPFHALLARNLVSGGLIEIAAIAVSDERDLNLDQGHKLLRQTLGLGIEEERSCEPAALFKSFKHA